MDLRLSAPRPNAVQHWRRAVLAQSTRRQRENQNSILNWLPTLAQPFPTEQVRSFFVVACAQTITDNYVNQLA